MSLFTCGAYTHPLAPEIRISRQRLGSAEGKQQCERRTWTIRGKLIGDQSSLLTQISALEAAYAADGLDVTLYANDGVTVLHQLLNSASLDGVKVVKRPDFPEGRGAQFATMRDYEIIVQADYLAADAASGTAWGDKTTSVTTDAQGQVRYVVSGSYRGPGAATAAAAAKLTGKLVESEQVNTNADTGTVSFEYAYTDAASRSVISSAETVEIETQLSRVVFQEVLGGGNPIKQTTVKPAVSARQSGEAVGLAGYPAPPDPLWPDDLVNKSITRSAPRRTKDAQLTEYKVAWTYVFVKDSDFNIQYPTNPPS